MSNQELDEALQTNLKLADQAEEAILEYERSRLKSINCHAEASLMRRISQLNVKAGYDIESFDVINLYLIMIDLLRSNLLTILICASLE